MTEQDEIREIGRATLDPVDQMMSRAPGGRALAARPLAVLVASIQRTAGRAGDDSNRSADIDHHGFRTKYDSRYVRVARQSLHGHRRDWSGELHVRGR